MNIIDIIILIILGLFLLYGLSSGLLKMIIVLIGFVLGSFLGNYLPKAMGVSFPLNFIFGIIIFIIFWVVFGIIAHFAGKLSKIIPFDRITGGILGLLLGVIFSFLIFSYLYNNVPALQELMDKSILSGFILSLSHFLNF